MCIVFLLKICFVFYADVHTYLSITTHASTGRRMVDEQHEWADDTQRNNAMALCASQIKDILNPGGHPPEGSILIHCTMFVLVLLYLLFLLGLVFFLALLFLKCMLFLFCFWFILNLSFYSSFGATLGAGGMHRTGMLFALIRRYVNDDPIEDILDEYKRHVAWVDAGTPGGFEELNEKFIREFDLSLIDAEDIVFENGFELDEDLDDANGISWGPGSFTKMLK